MPNFGGGVGQPIASSSITDPALPTPGAYPNCAISLTRYAEIIAYDEPAFWGVTYDGQQDLSCAVLWEERQRLEIARALAEAQNLIEGECGYPLCPTWVTDKQPFHCNPFQAKYAHVIEMGKAATADIALSEVVSFTTEPAIVGPIATSVTVASEIHIYLPGTDREIIPSKITLAGGFVTIEIPRARLILPGHDTSAAWIGYPFTDISNFSPTVDLRRIYNDATQTATFLDGNCLCAISEVDACVRIESHELGILRAKRALTGCNDCGQHYGLELYYKAGLTVLDTKTEQAIVRLAHTLVPESLCKQCDQLHRLWEKDTAVPAVLTRERVNCPFGLSDGAWMAYKKAQQMRVFRAGVL